MAIVLHPAHARRIAATAASTRQAMLKALGRLLAQLETLQAQCPVAPAGALERMTAGIATVVRMDFAPIAANEPSGEFARVRTIVLEAHQLAAAMTERAEVIVRRLAGAAAATRAMRT
jgi:hypothetical protein